MFNLDSATDRRIAIRPLFYSMNDSKFFADAGHFDYPAAHDW